jgi:hypothetical protein
MLHNNSVTTLTQVPNNHWGIRKVYPDQAQCAGERTHLFDCCTRGDGTSHRPEGPLC